MKLGGSKKNLIGDVIKRTGTYIMNTRLNISDIYDINNLLADWFPESIQNHRAWIIFYEPSIIYNMLE